MTDDLVKRLRAGWTEDGVSRDFDEDVLLIAADRIEELEAALKKIAQHGMQSIEITMDALRPGEPTRGKIND